MSVKGAKTGNWFSWRSTSLYKRINDPRKSV